MFSKMIAGLRREAEMVSGANCMILGEKYKKSSNELGASSINKTQATGMTVGAGGIVGIMGLTIINQAAAVGSVGLLASASTALAGLGTVAIGATVLPVASVVVLGALVAGVAALGIGSLRKIMEPNLTEMASHSHGELGRAIRNNDRETLNEIGKEDTGIGDWLKGAKNFVVKSLRDNFLGDRSPVIEAPLLAAAKQVPVVEKQTQAAERAKSGDALDLYELEDLLSGSLEESTKGKQGIVDLVAGDVWEKLGVVIADDDIHKCLGGKRDNEICHGKILDVDLKTGLVTQSLGRGRAAVHNLRDFDKAPVVGQDASITYKGGKMQAPKELGNERDAGRSVGR